MVKVHASGFVAIHSSSPIRAYAQREGRRTWSLGMNLCVSPHALIEDIGLVRGYPFFEEKGTGCLLSPTGVVLQNALLYSRLKQINKQYILETLQMLRTTL